MTAPRRRYRHLTRAQKAVTVNGRLQPRTLYRCQKCRLRMFAEDRARHVGDCEPEVVEARFKRED